MAKASRDKGARGELEVAEALRAWWEPFEPGVVFKRTPGSGGWANREARETFRTSGDLVTSSKAFPFCVEVKRREGWSWDTLLAGKASPVWGWWLQAIAQAAEQPGSMPLLFFRKSREPWSVMAPANVVFFGPNHLMIMAKPSVVSFPPCARQHRGSIEPLLMTAALFFHAEPAAWVEGVAGCAAMAREVHDVTDGAKQAAEEAGRARG